MSDSLRVRLDASAPETLYPEVEEVHTASSLATPEEVARYRGGWRPPEAPDPLADLALEQALLRRGSTRDFARGPVSADILVDLLARAMGPIRADVPPCIEPFVIAHAVEGLAPGVYRFHPPEGWEPLREGEFRRQAGYLCLEQPLGALAAAVVFFMTDLERVLEQHGDRGYRCAQLEGGIRSGRMYVGAFAHDLGATATTFYDEDVARFLAPGTPLRPMLAVAVGNRRRRGG